MRNRFCRGVPGVLACILAAGCLVGCAAPAAVAEPSWPPKGEPVKVTITRDTWLSSAGSEREGSNGGAAKLKCKGRMEYTLFDADVAALKGKIVTAALWHFHTASPADPLRRVTVSTVAAPWVEGTASGYRREDGAACYAQAELGKRDWAYPGGTFMDAAFGRGRTIWRFAESTAPDADGWQSCAVDADVVAARIAGLSHGFAAHDDVGSEWSYKDGEFKYMLMPNRFIHSREQREFAPYLQVWTAGTDQVPPAPVTAVAGETGDLPAGEALVKWRTPADSGGGKTLGFHVSYEAGGTGGQVPRYLIPMAGEPGQEVRMHLQDLPFKPGESVKLSISPVDSAGNVGKSVAATVRVSARPRVFEIAPAELKPFPPSEKLPEVGGLKVAVVDLVDKIHSVTGEMVPAHPAGYKGGNHIWSAARKLIRLQSARNEAVCFQVNLAGKSAAADVKLAFDAAAGVKARVYRLDCVKTRAGIMPDVCVPLTGEFAVPFKDDPEAAGASNVSLLCEVYVPHAAAAGSKAGRLTIASAGESVEISVELTVWDFTLPNKLSFIPEMNCYGTAGPTKAGMEYYRVAHEHRLCLNRLYYHWRGDVDYPPKWTGDSLDLTEWDKLFSPLLDGSAFADLPRKGEPVDVFYLPFNEHWPMDVYAGYRPSYWADEAFTDAYVKGLQKAFADMAAHCDRRGWHDTGFEFFLNGKVYNKSGGWTRASSPWVFDEPSNTQDFWALRWYGILFHQAVAPVKGKARMWYRCDVSRTQFGRDMLWGVMDVEVLGGASAQKMRMKRDEQVLSGRSYFSPYGTANDPAGANTQAVVWCLKTWSEGAVGLIPWQTIGNAGNMSGGSPTGLFIPHAGGVAPSLRVKAFRRGQQDVEYLTLLGDVHEQPQYAVAAGAKDMVNVAGRILKTSEADAGTIRFDAADPGALWLLRASAGAMVSAKRPAYKRCVRPMPLPPKDLRRLPDIGYVRAAPKLPPSKPEYAPPPAE